MSSPTGSSAQLPQKSPSTSDTKEQDKTTKCLPSNTNELIDKENTTKPNNFQPPSPLTSKRSKGTKSSSSQKSFGPRDTNIWGTHTSLDSTSGAVRHLRSSPIHREKSQTFQELSSGERREQGQHPGNSKSDSYSIAGDLEHMIKEDDEFSTSIGDFPNLGTFDEDSPAKDQPGNYQPRALSPPRGSPAEHVDGYYRSSPPSSYGRHPGYSSFYYDQSRGYMPPYYQPPRYGEQSHQPWSSPPAYDYGSEKHIPAPPAPREYDQGNIASPIKKKPRWDRDRTPERLGKPSKSPFRSPSAQNHESAKKYKRSPSIWGGGSTPNIGMYGSFDTPSGTGGAYLDEFSPMGPIFKPFEKNDSPSMPIAGEVLEGRFDSENNPGPPMRQPPRGSSQRHDAFISELAHMPGTMPLPSSPMRSNKDRESSCYYSEKDRDGRPTPSSTKRSQTGASKRHYFTSPMVRPHYASAKRDTWYDGTRQNPGPVRLELGEIGVKPSDTRKSLEGINNMLRGSSSSGRPNYSSEKSRSHGYHGDLSTPVKIDGPSSSRPSMSQLRNHVTPYPASGSGPMATPISNRGSRYPSHSSNMGHSGKASTRQPSMKTPLSSKEKIVTPASTRRNPCNCKKSKCLKLYCECFAAELFCDGCNCNDCKNTKEHESERNKAMKDTRAKNPNAFKPRIAVRGNTGPGGVSPSSEHNMGCKCKRSQCLKKYCECFQAGAMCNSSKCKCVDCLNYVGSQALIDKRRKIKDHRGADFAMRIADEAWKKGKHGPRPPPVNASSSSSRGRKPGPSPNSSHPSRNGHHMPLPPHMMHLSSPSHGPPGANPMYPHMMMGHPPVGYPMPMHPSSKPYTHGQKSSSQQRKRSISATTQATKKYQKEIVPGESHSGMSSNPSDKKDNSNQTAHLQPERNGKPEIKPAQLGPDQTMPVVTPATSKAKGVSDRLNSDTSRESEVFGIKESSSEMTPCPVTASGTSLPPITPSTFKTGLSTNTDCSRISTPRTPGVRLGYDATSSKKKRLSPGEKEATFPYFGKLPEQPKTTALAVFSFLSNDEIYNAGLVSRRWSRLAMDEELWQF